MPRGDLFPEIGPFETGYLPLTDGHVMYWEQVGNPRGMPALFLHGGPGAGAGAVHRRFFDPAFWRVIIFDQRGAGRSRPLGGLEANTTDASGRATSRRCATISASTAGCCSAAPGARRWRSPTPRPIRCASPAACCAACSSAGAQEVDWFLHGLGTLFPDAHAAFTDFLPEQERGDVLGAYLRRLTDPDPAVHMPAARAWSIYEGSCSTLLPSPDTVTSFAQDRTALGLARIEAHYFAHDLFLPPETRRAAARRDAQDRPCAGRDRAGPLRHDLSGAHRLRPRRGVADGAA